MNTADTALIQQLRAGDNDSWKQFNTDHSIPLYHYILDHLPHEQVEQNAMMDTMVAIIKGVHDFDESVPLETWIYTMADEQIRQYSA